MAFIKDLSTIADSIRREKEITNKMTIHDMATALKPSLILVDWEGTILKYYNREEALALEDFPAPSTFPLYTEIDHEYLVFTEWNWTIQEAKSWLGVHKSTPLIVGAIYDTVDQKNHYEYIEYIAEGGPFPLITKAKLHTNIFNNENDPNGEYQEEYETFFNSNLEGYYRYTLQSISLSNNCIFPIWPKEDENDDDVSCIASNYLNINIPRSITYVPDSAFEGSGSIEFIKIISLPATFTKKENYEFWGSSLKYLSFPDSMESFNISGFFGNYFKILECPNNTINLSGSIFYTRIKDVVIIPSRITSVGNVDVDGTVSLKAILMEGLPSIDISAIDDLPIEVITSYFRILCPYLKFYVPRINLSWFESATNWCIIYSDFFETIEDNIEYLESLGVNVDDYKGSEE